MFLDSIQLPEARTVGPGPSYIKSISFLKGNKVEQIFSDPDDQVFSELELFPGASIAPLAMPRKEGSIHRLRMKKGTVIPPHAHPGEEYVYVLEGTIRTGRRSCGKGSFWATPGGVRQGPHEAVTDVELLTFRLGPMGRFETQG